MSVPFDMVGLLYVGNWCVGKNGRGRILHWPFVCAHDVREEQYSGLWFLCLWILQSLDSYN